MKLIKNKLFQAALLPAVLFFAMRTMAAPQLPNILWLVSEDNSPLLGCYGDEFATTPHLDRLASEGFLYTHAYANAPVCAPARNTIASGIYANSAGHSNMRSSYKRGTDVQFHAELLKKLGYYCSNNSKTDYNTNVDGEIWDESSREAHYKNRADGQPFFAVFNTGISHESCLHKSVPAETLRHDSEQVPIPPYHPRTEAMKHDWAQYYDRVEDMDSQVGRWLDDLEKSGLADDTIVFYYGDHGGVLGRSKRYVYETGTRVPFIVRIPEKYKDLWPAENKGSKIDRLISFVDLTPTLLSLAGVATPEKVQGKAFLGKYKTPDPEYAFMFRDRMDEWHDMSRAVRNHKYRYIKNYMPYRIYGQPLEYLWRAPSMKSWETAYLNGECNEIQSVFWKPKPVEELYDTENDPWEVNNLAADPAYADVLNEMRHALHRWVVDIKDTGFVPEASWSDLPTNEPLYDYFHSKEFSIEPIVRAADLAVLAEGENAGQMAAWLRDENAAIQYWGATGLLLLGEEARAYIDELKIAAQNASANVAIVACEALYGLGEKEAARNGYLNVLKHNHQFIRTHALNSIYWVGDDSPEIQQRVKEILLSCIKYRWRYDYMACVSLFEKWGLEDSIPAE